MRRAGRTTAWIAIFAILLAALAPSLAWALAPSQQAMPWSEICSVTGKQAANGVTSNSGSGQQDGKVPNHCPFCLNHAGYFALPATPPDSPLPLDTAAASPCFLATTPSPHAACVSPPARAPPAHS